MRVLILGGNSYIAKSFINSYHDKFDLKVIKREGEFKDYFLLKQEDFRDVDVVINFTAIVHQKGADKEKHQKYNYELVRYLADLAKKAGVKQFVQLSTIAVYGKQNYIDSTTIPNPQTPYGKAKLQADNYLLSLKDKSFKVAIIRPPIVYGKDAPGNMHSLVSLIKKRLPLPLGYFKNKRAILCVQNLSFALYLIVSQKSYGVFLLKDKESPSIGSLIEQINKNSKAKSLILPLPSWFRYLLLHTYIRAFEKLLGDLIIDDSKTREKIGEYQIRAWKDCINDMMLK